MSNHDGINDETMNEMMKRFGKELNLGATGFFPLGKLTPKDEGEIKIAIGTEQNRVIIHFGKEIAWIGFDKTQAMELAKSIIEKAESLSEA